MSERRQRAQATMRRRIAARSPFLFWLFSQIFHWTLRHGVHAVRLANRPADVVLQAPQLLIFCNHPSWWDGIIFMYLADRLFAGRIAYAPIDQAMLDRYGFMGRIGAFGVEQHSMDGARNFIEACRIILADVRHVLVVTAQGRFADCRERPLRLEPGIAHLLEVAPQASYLPLAIEYSYWLEKRPEVLLRFGKVIPAADLAGQRPSARLARLEQSLTQTMDALAQDVIARNDAAFETLMVGQSGINFFYDLWRRVLARLSGRPFHAQHGAPP